MFFEAVLFTMTIDMTMTALTGMLKFQLFDEVVMFIVTSHRPYM